VPHSNPAPPESGPSGRIGDTVRPSRILRASRMSFPPTGERFNRGRRQLDERPPPALDVSGRIAGTIRHRFPWQRTLIVNHRAAPACRRDSCPDIIAGWSVRTGRHGGPRGVGVLVAGCVRTTSEGPGCE